MRLWELPLTLHAILIPIGSAGDVHPFVGLGTALRKRGHRVTVVTNGHFGPLVRRAGLDFVELGTEDEYQFVLNDPQLWEPTGGFKLVVKWAILKGMRPTYEILQTLNEPGETVVAAQASAFGARIAHETLGIPLVTVNLQPALMRSVHEPPALGPLPLSSSLPAAWNRLLYWLADTRIIDPLLAPEANAFRAELGLPPVRRFLAGWWQSPERILGLFPGWFAPPQRDWPSQTTLTGFPLYDESDVEPPSPEVEAFLAGGPPPIVFTPGSAMRHGRAFFEAAIDASLRLGRRAMLLSRFRDQLPATLPEGIGWFGFVPFSRVFPRAAAIVHHGGIGTTAQGLAAGVPQFIMPMAHDQFDNAARLVRLQVARSLPPRRFQGAPLARGLAELLNSPVVADQCRRHAQLLRNADPLEASCQVLERALEGRQRRAVPS
ncbi:MAG: glycosyltransferase [Isosphaeraceae bacterium]|nr:glycosyltransferase [Isosphaeraceae bacterium]